MSRNTRAVTSRKPIRKVAYGFGGSVPISVAVGIVLQLLGIEVPEVVLTAGGALLYGLISYFTKSAPGEPGDPAAQERSPLPMPLDADGTG